VTGEAALDAVVPVRLTEQYLRLWPHAERATIPHTGHLGLITRPDVFSDTVASFVDRQQSASRFGLNTEATHQREKRIG
jgi:pimeloyl-ACP methyl ester carboxylesterase